MFRILILLLFAFSGPSSYAAGPFTRRMVVMEVVPQFHEDSTKTLPAPHTSRALAAGLAIALGPFGGHRIYLGVDAKVPLIYGLTFGGFGVLAVIDLGHILFTKDLSVYRNNSKVFMWTTPRTATTTPP